MITLAEASAYGAQWLASFPEASGYEAGIFEFEGGYVLWPRYATTAGPRPAPLLGAASLVIDGQTGEATPWGSYSAPDIAADYQRARARHPRATRSVDPVEQFRRDLRRTSVPQTLAHLMTPRGRLLRVRSAKGLRPRLYPLVAETLATCPYDRETHGADRCAEAVALSDLLYQEEAVQGPIRANSDLASALLGSRLEVHWLREDGDPLNGRPAPSCPSCCWLLDAFRFEPEGDGPHSVWVCTGGARESIEYRRWRPLYSHDWEGNRQTPPPAGTASPRSRWEGRIRQVLTEGGWYPGRRVPELAAAAIAEVCEQEGPAGRHQPFEAAEEALSRFLNVCVRQNRYWESPFTRPARSFVIDPRPVAASTETLAAFAGVVGARLFPLGEEDHGASVLAIDEQGRVFALDHAGEWYLGSDIERALTALVLGLGRVEVRRAPQDLQVIHGLDLATFP